MFQLRHVPGELILLSFFGVLFCFKKRYAVQSRELKETPPNAVTGLIHVFKKLLAT